MTPTKPNAPRASSGWFVAAAVLCLLLGLWWWVGTRQRTDPPSTSPSTSTHVVTAPAATPTAYRPIPNPTSTSTITELSFTHFTVGYDDANKTPRWARYDLDGPITFTASQPSRPKFRSDDRTISRIRHDDFTNTGWSRGHLVPAFAQWSRWGDAARRETFVMSNVIPQSQGLNGGLWEDVEDDIAGQVQQGTVTDQGYAGRLRNITVFTGPIFDAHAQRLARGVPIPTAVFTIVYDFDEATGAYRAKAYSFPNTEGLPRTKDTFLTTIDAIETATALDFMPNWENQAEPIEKKVDTTAWSPSE